MHKDMVVDEDENRRSLPMGLIGYTVLVCREC
jgi:hypothetical protein